MVRQVAYVHGQRSHYIEQIGKNYTLSVILSLFALNSHLSAPHLWLLYPLPPVSIYTQRSRWEGLHSCLLTWLVATKLDLVGCLQFFTWGSHLSHGVTSRICSQYSTDCAWLEPHIEPLRVSFSMWVGKAGQKSLCGCQEKYV